MKLPAELIKPDYSSLCFSRIPETITSLFSGKWRGGALPKSVLPGTSSQFESVVFVLLDAFGWSFFEQYRESCPALNQIASQGKTTRITSQFPSTTATQVTTIHTGIPVGFSSIVNWQYYEPELDEIFFPLLFSTLGKSKHKGLNPLKTNGERFIPKQTLYQRLNEIGVHSEIFQHQAITSFRSKNTLFKGATVSPYRTLPEAFTNLKVQLLKNKRPSYKFLYVDSVDAICHKYGPDSPQFTAEVGSFFTMMNQLFFESYHSSDKTLFILTADHGQIGVDPSKTIYLNLDPTFSGINEFLKTNRQNRLMVPGGSARDMHLYIKPGQVDAAKSFLSSRLVDRAVVVSSNELVEAGYFGPPPLDNIFTDRLGDLVILPLGNHTVWWYERGLAEMPFQAHHGGLSGEEIYIPFLTAEI